MIKVSVLINNRDNAEYLESCIDSVLGQTRPADEIIVYDDGSMDGSRSVLERYGKQIKVISARGGVGTPMENQTRAIEESFRKSCGDFIFLLDSDDLFFSDHVEVYLDAFNRNERVIMVQAPLLKIDSQGQPLGLEYDRRRHSQNYLRHIYRTHDVNVYYPTSSLAFRRRYLEQRLPLEPSGLPLWPDAQLALIAPHFGEVVTLDQPKTCWRRHARSHTVVKSITVYEQMRMNRAYFNRFCDNVGLPRIRAWRSPEHMKRLLRHMCPPQLIELYQKRLQRHEAPVGLTVDKR
jgi:glycosyltransferase involved in cell wall biosynthesis